MIKENEFIELKKTTGEINEAMISISSILNKHQRGTLYFGIKNDGSLNSFTITDSTVRDVSRKIFESIKPQIIPTITTEEYSGGTVIKVEFSGSDIPYSAFGKYYIRIADEDRELNPIELRKIMTDKVYEESWEIKKTDYTADVIDEDTLKDFYKKAVGCGRLPDFPYEKVSLLKKLNLLAGDKLNNAGVFLFSKTEPISLKMGVFATDKKITFLDISKEKGNIFKLIDSAMSYIVKNMRWRVELDDSSIQRKEIPEVPVDALRECVINSFAHARYDSDIEHEIDIFSDRIDIITPGEFANDYSPEDFRDNNMSSFLRNNIIANVLYLCHDVESFGTGFQKIYEFCGQAGVAVSYEKTDYSFVFSFKRNDRNVALNVVSNVVLTEAEKKVLELIKKDPHIPAAEIAEHINKTSRTAQRILESLKNKKLIVRVGSKKDGNWKTNW